MSSGLKVSYSFASNLARRMVDLLEPDCSRIEIAGSLRRKKKEIGDVELCLIPRASVITQQADLFGIVPAEPQSVTYDSEAIERRLVDAGYVLKKNGDLFKQAHLPGSDFMFDIFLTTPEKWGYTFTIRTGSALFSHKLVTSKRYHGLCPSNMGVSECRFWYGTHQWDNEKKKDEFIPDRVRGPLETPEEIDVFNALGLAWIEPEERF